MMKNIYLFALLVSAILSVSLAGCAPAVAPVDGDVIGLYAGMTQWVIDQAARYAVQPGTEALYSSRLGLVVIGTPLHKGYAFTVLDAKTMTSLDDPEVVKSLRGNLVNMKTWTQFRDWLIATEGFVSQVLNIATTTLTRTWYTFGVGVYVPSVIEIPVEIKQ